MQGSRVGLLVAVVVAMMLGAAPAQAAAAPINDAFANSRALTGSSATASGSNIGATAEPGEPYHDPNRSERTSVWWTWTAPDSGGATIDSAGSDFNTVVAVYTGDSVSTLTPVAENDNVSYSKRTSRLSFRAQAGTTYRIVVDSAWDYGTGSINLNLTLGPPPGNDLFANATPLPSETHVSTAGRNDGASAEPGEPSHYAFAPARSSVWFTWTAPQDGSLTIRTDTDFARDVAVYTGDEVTTLTPRRGADVPVPLRPGLRSRPSGARRHLPDRRRQPEHSGGRGVRPDPRRDRASSKRRPRRR